MKKESRKLFFIAIATLAAFVLWTILVYFVDRKAVGPDGSVVGFATLNRYIHSLTGVNTFLYTLTDYLSIIPLGFVGAFAVIGLAQLIKRRDIRKVDHSLLALGGFYTVVMAAFLFFEAVIVNYRPVLIDGVLEASYPSSTTMLVLCVMPTAFLQLKERIKSKKVKLITLILTVIFTAFMVIARIISGVHWFSDIIGGGLLSTGLVTSYILVSKKMN